MYFPKDFHVKKKERGSKEPKKIDGSWTTERHNKKTQGLPAIKPGLCQKEQ